MAEETVVAEAAAQPENGVKTEEIPASESPTEGEKQEAKKEELPFGKHPRWQKMQEANRRYKSQLAEMQRELESLSGAKALHQQLTSDPSKLRAVLEILEGKKIAEGKEEKDPYADFAPDVAERFRKLDQLEAWKASVEEQRKEEEKRIIQRNMDSLENSFLDMLKADSWLKSDGTPVDEKTVKVISSGVLATLMEIAEDQAMPTREELKAAYDAVMQAFKPIKNRALRESVAIQSPPPSGSGSGQPASVKLPKTRAERIAESMRIMEQ